jgi:hypothetical protein
MVAVMLPTSNEPGGVKRDMLSVTYLWQARDPVDAQTSAAESLLELDRMKNNGLDIGQVVVA